MIRKQQFFVNKQGVHTRTKRLIRGLRYPDEKGRVMYLMFKVSLDKQYLVLMKGGLPWTAGRIRGKDGWVKEMIDLSMVSEDPEAKFGYLYKTTPPQSKRPD